MVCKNRRRVLYARDAQILLGQPNVGSQEDGPVRGTHSVDSSEQRVNIYNRTKQQHEKSMITRTTSSGPAAPAGGSLEPPMSGSLTAAVMLSAPLISRWSFGVLVHLVASSGTLWPATGAMARRNNDLASGARVLFFLRPRPLGTIGAGGVTPTGSVTFRTDIGGLIKDT
ncbi:hypothetical protein T08_7560 [Trichinella sp. T8]|nr:hypothetical protein T08_7560 [Trichinella sp. T8]